MIRNTSMRNNEGHTYLTIMGSGVSKWSGDFKIRMLFDTHFYLKSNVKLNGSEI